MLMATILGFGICASAYLIYKNKNKVSLKILDISLKMEEYYLKIRGDLNYELIPDDNKNMFKISNKYNDIFTQPSDILLRQAYNINDNPCQYYIQVFDINNRIFCFLQKFENIKQIIINENIIKYNSPIISCSLNVLKNNNFIYEDYDITECLNTFINYNSEIILSNNRDEKKIWIYYFNYIFASRNAFINYNNIDDIKFSWNIMKDNMEIITGEEIIITTTAGICSIKNIN